MNIKIKDMIELLKKEAKYLSYPQIKEQVEFFIETECYTSTSEEELKLTHYLLNEIYS